MQVADLAGNRYSNTSLHQLTKDSFQYLAKSNSPSEDLVEAAAQRERLIQSSADPKRTAKHDRVARSTMCISQEYVWYVSGRHRRSVTRWFAVPHGCSNLAARIKRLSVWGAIRLLIGLCFAALDSCSSRYLKNIACVYL